MRLALDGTIPDTRADRSAATLSLVATLLALADLGTKQLAVARLGAGPDLALGAALRLTLLFNQGLAGGLGERGTALAVTVAGTALVLAAVAAVRRPLAAVDASSPLMLGLIVGAALGNASSIVLWPAGAPDFIALDRGDGVEAVLNVADVGLFVGLALCARTTWRIAVALRHERTRHPSLARHAAATGSLADAFAAAPTRPATEWNAERRQHGCLRRA